MAVVFRPLSAGAVKYKQFADRLARTAARSGGGTQVIDGFLLRAVRAGENVVVYAIDPEAVWAFLHHGTLSGFGTHLKLAARALNRDVVAPGASLADVTPVAKAAGTTLLPYSAGEGSYPAIDLAALLIVATAVTVPHVYPDSVTTCVLARSSNNAQATFATDKFQLWTDKLGQTRTKWYAPGADTSEFVGYYERVQAFLLPENGLATVLADADARLFTRQASRYKYSIPSFAAQQARNGVASPTDTSLWRADPIVAGAYVSQPTGSDAPGWDEATDPARYGIAGVFIARFRRPEVPSGAQYTVPPLHSFSRLMTDNPETELVPLLIDVGDVNRYATHGVAGTGMCYTQTVGEQADPADGLGARGTAHLFSVVHCDQAGVVWNGVQLCSVDPLGASSAATLYKSTAARGHLVGPEVSLFDTAGIVGVAFDIAAGAMNQTSVDLVHMGVDGVLRTSDLRTHGWYCFTQFVLNPVGAFAASVFGQASLYAADIGDDKVAVLARDYVVPGAASTVDWTLVVVRGSTGAFIEARGLVGAAFTVTSQAHIVVVSPESTVDAGLPSEVTTPAVLLCALDTTHRLSTDGGVTWTTLFTGFTGAPLYMGNQLHRVAFGETI